MGATRAIALCNCFGGVLDFQRGRWSQAEAKLEQAIAQYRAIGAASGEALWLQRLASVFTARGRLDDAHRLLEESLLAAERAMLRSHCLTRAYATLARNRLAAGDRANAVKCLEAADLTARR